jgi:hypothetical protein
MNEEEEEEENKKKSRMIKYIMAELSSWMVISSWFIFASSKFQTSARGLVLLKASIAFFIPYGSHDSSVGIATRIGAGRLGL